MKEIWYEQWFPYEIPRENYKYDLRMFILIADLCDELIDCTLCPLNPRPAKCYCDICPFY
jgi:hypothetical protein